MCGAHPTEDPRPEEMRPTPDWQGSRPQSLRAPRSLFLRGSGRGRFSPATTPGSVSVRPRPVPALSPLRRAQAYPRGLKPQQQPRQQHKKAPPPPQINDPQRHQNREANKPRGGEELRLTRSGIFLSNSHSREGRDVGTQPDPGPRSGAGPVAREP